MSKPQLLFWLHVSYLGLKFLFDNLSLVIEAEWYREKIMGSELILNLSPSTFYRVAECLWAIVSPKKKQ